ncbi:hypothetical protein P7C73_g425, partial [Tremellales sp. Uapishka_1]
MSTSNSETNDAGTTNGTNGADVGSGEMTPNDFQAFLEEEIDRMAAAQIQNAGGEGSSDPSHANGNSDASHPNGVNGGSAATNSGSGNSRGQTEEDRGQDQLSVQTNAMRGNQPSVADSEGSSEPSRANGTSDASHLNGQNGR